MAGLENQFATNEDYGNAYGATKGPSMATTEALPPQYGGQGNAYGDLQPHIAEKGNSAPATGMAESTLDDIRGGQGNADGGKPVDAVVQVKTTPFADYVMDEAFERMPAQPQLEQISSKRYPITNAEIDFEGQRMHNPLTEKGEKVMHSMAAEYGEKKGKKVFYASRNKGTIKGVD